MEKHILLLIFSFFVLKHSASAKDHCKPAFCGPLEPEVRFPFRLIGQQPDRCGYPGFDLSCDEHNKTIIQFPLSPSYIVIKIYYNLQVMDVDMEFCRPKGIVSANITNTPFRDGSLASYTFYNCSAQNYSFVYPNMPYPCLSSRNYSVIAALTDSIAPYHPLNCEAMKTIQVPAGFDSHSWKVLGLNRLIWYIPNCFVCEDQVKACRLESDDGKTGCDSTSSGGISRSAKYGLSIGIGVPALICIISLVWYASSKVQANNDSNNQGIELFNAPINPQPASQTGLDGHMIESYPLTVLGDSCSIPSDDGSCAICLCDYKPKDSLRTIPKCNHYFHVRCIDEWLKMQATCPVCRKTP